MHATAPPLPPPILIAKKFRVYDKAIRDIWESYQFHRFYLPVLHNLIKKERVPAFILPSLGAVSGQKEQNRKDTLGAISHIMSQVSPQRTLVVAVSHSELFLQYLVTRVLRDHPERLLSGAQMEVAGRETKILEILIRSDDKREMLDKVIEERVRAVFYGAPADFFLKDKAKLGFADYFSAKLSKAVDAYVEFTARRNLFVHSDGRVDRKYLREVPSSTMTLGQKVTVEEPYLRTALLTLRGLCAHAGVLVSERIYNNTVPAGRMLLRRNALKE
jgi:hypothetical protein